jgi:hypothetical protein
MTPAPAKLLILWLRDADLCSSNNLEMLITREQMRVQPQYYIKLMGSKSGGSSPPPPERLLSDFPHPYPSIRNLQREVIR